MSRNEVGVVAWICAAFACVAVAGLAVLPSATIVWIALIVFAVCAIPQALLRRASRRPEAPAERPRDSSEPPGDR